MKRGLDATEKGALALAFVFVIAGAILIAFPERLNYFLGNESAAEAVIPAVHAHLSPLGSQIAGGLLVLIGAGIAAFALAGHGRRR